MPLISEWKPSDPIQILVYGQAKTGKTWGAMTFPRPVVFDFDHGIATARNPEFVKKYGQRWAFYEEFYEEGLVKGIPKSHNAFDDACRFFDEWMKPHGRWRGYEVGCNMFDTFIIDSGTTLSEFAQYKAIIVMGEMKLSLTHKEATDKGLLVPKIQDYGSERSLVEQFVDMVMGSGKNVVLICHEKEVTTKEGGIVTGIVPLFTGKSVETIPLKFDEVYNLRTKKDANGIQRYLQTQPDGLRKVGTRYGIPDGSEWSWDTVQAELNKIKTGQLGQTSPQTK